MNDQTHYNMNTIIKTIESFKRKRFTGSVSSTLIENAEKELGICITPEYKEILQEYGSLCVKGEEFLGIDDEHYDLVKATQEARKNDVHFPQDVYVIENTAIDGILIVQRNTGALYTYQPNSELQHLAHSLEEYLLSL